MKKKKETDWRKYDKYEEVPKKFQNIGMKIRSNIEIDRWLSSDWTPSDIFR